MGLIMVCYGGLWGILSGLTKSTDHPSRPYVGEESSKGSPHQDASPTVSKGPDDSVPRPS